MKYIHVQKQIIGWEEYTYKVPDDFEDYDSLIESSDYSSYEYLEGSSEETGLYEIYDENYNLLT